MKLKVPRQESPMKVMNFVERGVYLKEFSPNKKKEIAVPVSSGASTARVPKKYAKDFRISRMQLTKSKESHRSNRDLKLSSYRNKRIKIVHMDDESPPK